MLKFYQEITIIPEPEIPLYDMWTRVFTQLHIALADVKNTHGIDTIGVSFPNYQFTEKQGKTFATLGYKLRVFAPSENELQALDLGKWLARLTDYLHLKSIQRVPDKHSHVIIRRYRHKSVEKVAERFAKFKGIDFETALAHCQAHKQPAKTYPYISLKSETTQVGYRLTIWQQSAKEAIIGKFNTYGINAMAGQATVPHW